MPSTDGSFRGQGWSRAREKAWERAFGRTKAETKRLIADADQLRADYRGFNWVCEDHGKPCDCGAPLRPDERVLYCPEHGPQKHWTHESHSLIAVCEQCGRDLETL